MSDETYKQILARAAVLKPLGMQTEQEIAESMAAKFEIQKRHDERFAADFIDSDGIKVSKYLAQKMGYTTINDDGETR